MTRLQETGSVTWRSYVEGPRWARFGKALRDRVWADSRLRLVACEDERGLVRATTRFVVRGSESAIAELQRDIAHGAEDWNGS